MRILLIEDDSATAQILELILKVENYGVYTTNLAEEALSLLGVTPCDTDLDEESLKLLGANQYDLILIGIHLVGENPNQMQGWEFIETLYKAGNGIPILILSGLAGVEYKVRGLNLGADDYLTKPFHKDELLARIKAVRRRVLGYSRAPIIVGDLVLNLDKNVASMGRNRLPLTEKEFQLLELLASREGTTISKEMILNHLYGGVDEPELKSVDIFICKLRKKIASASGSGSKNYIETVRGRGYRLCAPDENTPPAATP